MNLFNDSRKLGAWAGLISSVLFVSVFLIDGWLREGYNPLSMCISELALGPMGWIQTINFIMLGSLLLLFSKGVAVEFKNKAGLVLLIIISIGYIALGVFPTDPVTPLSQEMTLIGDIHQFISSLVFTLMPISCFVFFMEFRDNPEWKSFQYFTLIAGFISTSRAILLSLVANPSAIPNLFIDYAGLIQRLIIIAFLSWIFVFALKLKK